MKHSVNTMAPDCGQACEYDQGHLSLYAGLLDAAAAGEDWRASAARLMGIDVEKEDAQRCYQSHLDRARWIVGEGLASAIEVFGLQDIEG